MLIKYKFKRSYTTWGRYTVILTIFERLLVNMVNLRAVFTILLFSTLISAEMDAQFLGSGKKDPELIQFSGIIRNLEHRPIGHVNIVILNRNRGTTADGRGLFSFVVQPNDTILFSHVGHKSTLHVIPDTLDTDQYPSDIFMVSDTFRLAEVKIFPWKTYQEFKEDFIAMEMPTDDEQRAMKNIALIKTQIKMNDVTATPNMNFREVMQQQYNQLYYEGQYPYYTIFDPLRWAEFFNALKRGDFRRDD